MRFKNKVGEHSTASLDRTLSTRNREQTTLSLTLLPISKLVQCSVSPLFANIHFKYSVGSDMEIKNATWEVHADFRPDIITLVM